MAETKADAKTGIKQANFEAILKGTGAVDNAEFLREIKPLYNVDRPSTFYSSEVYIQFLEAVRNKVYPDLSPDEAYYRIGVTGFEGYMHHTIVGRVAMAGLALMRLGNVRAAKVGDRIWKDAGMGEAESEQLTKTSVLSHYRSFLIHPGIVLGSTYETLKLLGGKNIRHILIYLPSSKLNNYDFDVIYEWD